MKGLRIGFPAVVVAAVLLMLSAELVPEVAAMRFIAGGNKGWTKNVNYKSWAKGKHFYLGDWIFFVYDRNKMSVLEVSRGDYERCIARRPLHNWSNGAGRDVVPLNVTKTYYFISGNGFCYKGMKLAIHVEKRHQH
ncbi:hypothetical protein RD792_016829 [Penstemon davidsonii]|uniref:Phytocyanin domain-containing protein n=1 Tax=Penstemon davidsonii TaxID=160366 RepID=A0ABR0CMX4_9LAMI|nr:hypothetical protein RD792_016829 [Penstemon davidsonii]